MTNEERNGRDVDLRPLIARLKEIERKCVSMGTRNEEFPLMKERLTSIISRLEAGEEPSGEPLAYRAIARELFPVAHLFESVGFMSVGKEIAHVERALRELEPEPAAPVGSGAPARTSPTSSAAPSSIPEKAVEHEFEREKTEEEEAGEAIPKPILGGFVILLAAVAVAAALVFKVGPFQPKVAPNAFPPSPTAVPSPTPEPPPTPAPPNPDAARNARERVADAVSQARLSLLNGDVDAAVNYLSIAALIDRNDTSVLETANRVVDQLLRDANAAAAEARWEDAARITGHARTVATHFALATERIDAAERRHADMRRYRIVEPKDTQSLRESIGKRVDVKLNNGSMLVGHISGLDHTNLVLDIDDNVGGGIVSFSDEIPLATIRWIKIWED